MALQTHLLPPRYRDPERIGVGGMGEIYRAHDETLGRSVAIKVLSERYAQDEAVRQRFTREALAAARLSGEAHTITIFDVGEWEGRPFIVMEYIGGGSLEERLRREGAQPPARALRWLEQAAAALDAAHAKGVVHRDVKPGNLLLTANEDVVVADYGVATAVGLDSLTMTGTVLGTAGYLAPEQARGEATTPASDRYALAVVAFELLTGQRPYQNDSPTAEAASHVHAEIPSACERDTDLPCELDAVFARALAKDPKQRFRTAGDFVVALREALTQSATITSEIAPTAPLPPRRARSVPLPLLVGALLLAAVLAGVGLAAALAGGDDEPRALTVTTERVTTVQGEVQTRTVVTTAPAATQSAPPPPPATPPPPPAAGGNGVALTDQATSLLRAQRWAEAESVARQAVSALGNGSNRTYLAYAYYDLGRALAEQGKCAEAIGYLNRREQMLGPHPDVTAAKRKCGA